MHPIRRAPQCKYRAKSARRSTAFSNAFVRNNVLARRFCGISRYRELNKQRQRRNDDRASTCRDRSQKDDWSTRHPSLLFLHPFFFLFTSSLPKHIWITPSILTSNRPPCQSVCADLSFLYIQFSPSPWVIYARYFYGRFVFLERIKYDGWKLFLSFFTILSRRDRFVQVILLPRNDFQLSAMESNIVKTEKVWLFCHY